MEGKAGLRAGLSRPGRRTMRPAGGWRSGGSFTSATGVSGSRVGPRGTAALYPSHEGRLRTSSRRLGAGDRGAQDHGRGTCSRSCKGRRAATRTKRRGSRSSAATGAGARVKRTARRSGPGRAQRPEPAQAASSRRGPVRRPRLRRRPALVPRPLGADRPCPRRSLCRNAQPGTPEGYVHPHQHGRRREADAKRRRRRSLVAWGRARRVDPSPSGGRDGRGGRRRRLDRLRPRRPRLAGEAGSPWAKHGAGGVFVSANNGFTEATATAAGRRPMRPSSAVVGMWP